MNPKPGTLAASAKTFGPRHRYAIAPVHSRLGGTELFVWDAETKDELGLRAVIRQGNDPLIRQAWAALNQRKQFPADEALALHALGLDTIALCPSCAEAIGGACGGPDADWRDATHGEPCGAADCQA